MKLGIRIFTAILVVLATCCCLNIYFISTQKSDTYGNFDNADLYQDFNVYELNETDITFYASENVYTYTKDYRVSIDFNGTKNKYNLLFNNKPCDKIMTTAGSLYAEYNLSFYDINEELISLVQLDIRYTFYVSHFVLTIQSTMTEEQHKLLNEYFAVNGCNLRVIDNVYYGGNGEELEKVYVNFYNNDELVAVHTTGCNSVLTTDYTKINLDTKTKYLVGWALKGTTDLIDLSTYKFNKNTDLVAIFKDKPTITFNAYSNKGYIGENNGILKEISCDIGSNYVFDTNDMPSITNYTFSHWVFNGQTIFPGDAFSLLIEKDKSYTISAYYIYDFYTVAFYFYETSKYDFWVYEFDTIEEIIEMADSIDYDCSSKDLFFMGWGTEELEFIDINTYEFEKCKPITLYGRYALEEDITKVNFYSNDALVESVNVMSNNNLVVKAPVVTSSNAVFVGWFEDSNLSIPADLSSIDLSSGEINLYAKFQLAYQLIIYVPGDVTSEVLSSEYRFLPGAEITYDFLTTIVPEKEDYTLVFNGMGIVDDITIDNRSVLMPNRVLYILPTYIYDGYTFNIEYFSSEYSSYQLLKKIEIDSLSDLINNLPTVDEIPTFDGKQYAGIYFGYTTSSPRIDGVSVETLETYGFEKSKIIKLQILYTNV